MRAGSRAWLSVLVLAAGGCSDQGMTPQLIGWDNPEGVSYAADIQPLFDGNCLGCHGTGGNGGLDLQGSVSFGNLVGAPSQGYVRMRVMAGDPAASVLYLKLTGDPGAGARMPVGGALTSAQTDLVRDWILQGAPDN